MFGGGGCFLWGFDKNREFHDGMIDDYFIAWDGFQDPMRMLMYLVCVAAGDV